MALQTMFTRFASVQKTQYPSLILYAEGLNSVIHGTEGIRCRNIKPMSLWYQLATPAPSISVSQLQSTIKALTLKVETQHNSRSNRVSLFPLEYTRHFSLSFRRKMRARNVTSIPMKKRDAI